jgi:hypothetical protein
LIHQQDIVIIVNSYNSYAIAVLYNLAGGFPAAGHLHGVDSQLYRPPIVDQLAG